MKIDLTIKNYRCFSDSKPAHFTISRGFCAFVGPNNAGKSSLLKFFFEFRGIFGILSTDPNALLSAIRGNTTAFQMNGTADVEELFCNQNDRAIQINLVVAPTTDGESRMLTARNPEMIAFSILRGTNTFKMALRDERHQLSPAADANLAATIVELQQLQEKFDFALYIGTFAALANSLYIGPYRNIINVGTNTSYFDISIGQAFVGLWHGWQAGNSKAASRAALQLAKEIQDIFDFSEFQILSSNDGQTLQLIVDGHSFRLTEMGAGIAQFILVLANAAIKKPSLILIDEPELHLHPSLQIDFLTTLAHYASEGMLFATHNIGLARATAEQIYCVRRIKGGSELVSYESARNLSAFLGEMSFSGYQALGFDLIVLVEGVTEVKTIQQFLRKFKIDHRVLPLPLGGSQFINPRIEVELQELKRISSNIFALIDSERAFADAPLASDREGFRKLCDEAGIPCTVLRLRAIENYFTDAAIKAAINDKYSALAPYEKLSSRSLLGWGKSENWKIAREMSIEDLAKRLSENKKIHNIKQSWHLRENMYFCISR